MQEIYIAYAPKRWGKGKTKDEARINLKCVGWNGNNPRYYRIYAEEGFDPDYVGVNPDTGEIDCPDHCEVELVEDN